MAPATDKSVSEIATNLLVPPIGAFSSRGHSPTTDNSVRVEIHRSASYVVYVRCYARQTVHNNPRINMENGRSGSMTYFNNNI